MEPDASSNKYMAKLKEKGYLLYIEAIAFGMCRYGPNLRKDGKTSQLIHCLRVAEILRNEAHVTDWETLISAVLHDVFEESVARYEDIEKRFGKKVADIVAELTPDKRLPKVERKKEILSKLKSLSPEAKLVKLADALDNAGDPWLIKSKIAERYFKETKEILVLLEGTSPELECFIDQIIKIAKQRRKNEQEQEKRYR